MIIRYEKEEDYHASELMVMRAFYNRQQPGCNEHYLLHLLRTSSDYLPAYSRVAELRGRIVGAIYFSKAHLQTAEGDIPIVTFGPLAVDPAFQGLGIGRKLFAESVALLRKTSYPAIVIYGEPDYYPQLGFQRAKEFGISDPEGNVFDALMAFELHTKSLKGLQGKFFESPVFEKSNDGEAAMAFSRLFPPYPRLKVPAQWLHRCQLGRIESIDGANYQIRFWELIIPATLAPGFVSPFPRVGDWVTFIWHRKGPSWIQTVEIPE